MFKKSKNAIVNMSYEENGHSGSSITIELKDGELLKELKAEYQRHGKLVIERFNDNEIYLTTVKTLEYQHIDNKLDKIKNLIRNYISNSNS